MKRVHYYLIKVIPITLIPTITILRETQEDGGVYFDLQLCFLRIAFGFYINPKI